MIKRKPIKPIPEKGPQGFPYCPGCGWEIDPDCCHCGEDRKYHGYETGHSFVPQGCTCGYNDADKRRNPEFFLNG